MENVRYFLYCTSANQSATEALLDRKSIVYDSHDAIQDGIVEISFSADINAVESLKSEILNGTIKAHLTDTKLPIAGSIGAISVDFTDTNLKVSSTDQTAANIKYLLVDSTGQLYIAPHSSLLSGSKVTTDANAVAIAATASCRKVTVQADHANTDYVLIGNATSQTVKLYAGDSITLEVNDVSKVYIKRPSSTDVTINYVGSN